jgi:hypothetical protein
MSSDAALEIETPEARQAQQDNLPARFVMLEADKRALEAKLKQINEEMEFLEGRILEAWSDAGQQSASINGYTVYVTVDFFCTKRGGVDTAGFCELLKANGLGNIVGPTYAANSLKAWVKERRDNQEEIPQEIAERINAVEVARLRCRKA